MATSNKTINTRVQLKSDTEENWRKSVLSTDHALGQKTSGTSFVPLSGELIVFTADSTHPFSRLKVGNGSSNVLALPFIDSGTLNGLEDFVVKAATRSDFPQEGSSKKLYIDISTNKVYHYTPANSYTELINVNFSVSRTTVSDVIDWSAGTITDAIISDHVLQITLGTVPTLNRTSRSVISDITMGGASS